MTNPDLQYIECDRLRIGVRGGRTELIAAIDLCRRFDGRALFREGNVVVVEVNGPLATINNFLIKLPERCVTHFWRRRRATVSSEAPCRETNFCGI